MSLFEELKRRNVFRVAIAYLIVGWLVLQVSDTLAPALLLPEWIHSAVAFVLILGFPLVMLFAWAFELTPEGLKREKHVDRSQSITHVTGRKLDFVIIAVLSAGIVFLLVDRFLVEPTTEPVTTASVSKSIAVLPFANMSGEPEQEFFSDGITEEILNALARVDDLRVTGRTSSFAFKGKNQDLREIGETLGVEHILEGSVRKSGDTVRITAQLIQVADGFHLWSESYDRKLDDIFAIQDEIAGEILRQLKTRLLDGDLPMQAADRTDPAVYERYLLAKQRLYQRTAPMIQSAADLLDEAMAIDPDYAPAHAQRAVAAMLLSDQSYGSLPERDSQRVAKRYLDRALELDPDLAEAWAAMGLYWLGEPGAHETAIDVLTRALELNPNQIDASNWLYNALSATGSMTAALEVVQDMVARDPLYRPGFANVVLMYQYFGMTAEARSLMERFARFYADDDPLLLRTRAITEFTWGDTVAGLEFARRADALEPGTVGNRFALSIGLSQTMQLETLAELGIPSFQVHALDYLGRRDEAFEVARKTAELGYPGDLFLLYNRSGRSQAAIDYVDERWPDLSALASEVPPGGFGDYMFTELAIAYRRTGDHARADEALQYSGQITEKLEEHGSRHFVVLSGLADYYAAAGDFDRALELLDASVQSGWKPIPDLSKLFSSLAPLRDDPRLAELENLIVENINAERARLDLEPIAARQGNW